MAIKSEFSNVAAMPSPNEVTKITDGVAAAIHRSASSLQDAAVAACEARDPNLVWQMVNAERTLRRMASNLSRRNS